MPSSLSRLAAAMLGSTLIASVACAHDHAPSRGRLVFADHEKPVVRVLDLDSGEVTHDFPVPNANPVFAGVEGGRYVAIKTGDDAGTVRLLDTGLIYEPHGDHVDLEKGAVRLLDLTVTGQKPAHVISGNGQLALFFDGIRPWDGASTAKAVLLSIRDLDKAAPKQVVWQSPGPQHGISVPLGKGQWLMSVPNPAYVKGDDKQASSRPNGFEVLAQAKGNGSDWKRLAVFNDPAKADASCRLYHGLASAGGRHVLGCAEGEDGGVLVLSRQGKGKNETETVMARRLRYPDTERRISAIRGRDGGQFMVANYGRSAPYDALIRIDAKAEKLVPQDIQAVPGGQSACQFELSGNGRRLANLTPDGKLRVYEMAPAWKEVASFDAVPAFDCAYGARTPTPSLAVIGENAFVSDPENGRIREFHLGTLKQGLDLPVQGKPANLAGADAG